jgi:hypothetical protein
MIDAEVVGKMFVDCLYTAEEVEGLPEGEAPKGCVMIDGITTKFGLHPKRLESYRTVIADYLSQLPDSFKKSSGGGMSFLNACNLEDGTQWTGMHKRMEELFSMGIGLGIVNYALPRELWQTMPGGMPYLIIDM